MPSQMGLPRPLLALMSPSAATPCATVFKTFKERLMAIGRWRKIATAAAAAADAAPAAVFAAGYCWQLLLPLGGGVPCAKVLKRG